MSAADEAKRVLMLRMSSLRNVVMFLDHDAELLHLLEEELSAWQARLIDRAIRTHSKTEEEGNGEESCGDGAGNTQCERSAAEAQT